MKTPLERIADIERELEELKKQFAPIYPPNFPYPPYYTPYLPQPIPFYPSPFSPPIEYPQSPVIISWYRND